MSMFMWMFLLVKDVLNIIEILIIL